MVSAAQVVVARRDDQLEAAYLLAHVLGGDEFDQIVGVSGEPDARPRIISDNGPQFIVKTLRNSFGSRA
jgi:hypothetical protein